MRSMEESKHIVVVPTFCSQECVGTTFYEKLSQKILNGSYKLVVDDSFIHRKKPGLERDCPAWQRLFFKILEGSRFFWKIKPSIMLCASLLHNLTQEDFFQIKAFVQFCERFKNSPVEYIIFPYQSSFNKSLLSLCAFHLAKNYRIKTIIVFLDSESEMLQKKSRDYFANRVLEKVSYAGFCRFVAASYEIARTQVENIAAYISIYDHAPVHADESREKCALIFYTVKNFASVYSGSSMRVHLLGSFLRSKRYDIAYLISEQSIHAEQDVLTFSDEKTFIDKIIYVIRKNYTKIPFSMEIIQIYLHFIAGHTRKFKMQCAKALLGKDILYLEHVHYARNLLKVVRSANLKTFLTMYDDDANRCKLHFVARIIRENYKKISPLCTEIATVAKSEHESLVQQGISNYLIPSTSDLLTINKQVVAAAPLHDAPRKRILFVGSRYYPNIHAKNRIKTWAVEFGKKNDWDFVVVGGCAEKDESFDSFVARGMVSQKDLIDEYARSDVIIAPLTEGTGASVKTIEGMATAKPFLGTDVAFRGLSVKDAGNCYIENDLDNFPIRIKEILSNLSAAARVGASGADYALEYDYRQIFVPYSDAFM